MRKLISKILEPYIFDCSDRKSLYDKIKELEQRISILEEENAESTRLLMSSVEALDERIDILAVENYGK